MMVCVFVGFCFSLGPSPFFIFRLVSNAFPDIGSVSRIEKQKPKKNSQEVAEQEALVPQDDIQS